MADDNFESHETSLDSPAANAAEITPNDGADLATPARAISVAVAGNVKLTTSGGDTVTVFVAAGSPFPIRATRIFSTDTTATGIVGLS